MAKRCKDCGRFYSERKLFTNFPYSHVCPKYPYGIPPQMWPIAESESPKDKNIYVISSKEYKNIEDAKEQIGKWEAEGTLDSRAKIYKISNRYKVEVNTKVEVIARSV